MILMIIMMMVVFSWLQFKMKKVWQIAFYVVFISRMLSAVILLSRQFHLELSKHDLCAE